jgi:hypothetical protein
MTLLASKRASRQQSGSSRFRKLDAALSQACHIEEPCVVEAFTLALASRLGAIPGGADAPKILPIVSHSDTLSRAAESNGSQSSQPIARFSGSNVDGHVDGLEERADFHFV